MSSDSSDVFPIVVFGQNRVEYRIECQFDSHLHFLFELNSNFNIHSYFRIIFKTIN